MIPRRSGRIILTSSMVSKAAFPGLTCYSSSKFAVNGLTQGLALELGQYNITVNAVAPGIVYTNIWEYMSNTIGERNNQSPVETFKSYTDTIPLGRPQTAEDLANMVAFVASDEAKNITGQVLAVCGGKTPI
jgi:meso-butanediol dehydrogenase/(S,S)-butanediol dehydrogenase/diacetyl reductase